MQDSLYGCIVFLDVKITGETAPNALADSRLLSHAFIGRMTTMLVLVRLIEICPYVTWETHTCQAFWTDIS